MINLTSMCYIIYLYVYKTLKKPGGKLGSGFIFTYMQIYMYVVTKNRNETQWPLRSYVLFSLEDIMNPSIFYFIILLIMFCVLIFIICKTQEYVCVSSCMMVELKESACVSNLPFFVSQDVSSPRTALNISINLI